MIHKNFKNIDKVVFGRGSFDNMAGILAEKQNENDGFFLFVVDNYFEGKELLQRIQPDIIFTQDVCEVCQIDTACTAAAVANLKKQPRLIALTPQNLDDVFETAVTVATAVGKEEAAYRYLSALKKKKKDILDALRFYKMPLKRVTLMEWIEPIYNCGHWIPFQLAQAGGIDMLSNPGGDSIVVPWEKIIRYNPEVLVIAACGFTIARARDSNSAHLSACLSAKPESRCFARN